MLTTKHTLSGGSLLLCFFLFILPVSFLSCQSSDSDSEIMENKSYVDEIQDWRQNRIERLKSPDGWLSLTGLFWLEEGKNTFGADSSNDIVFSPKAPDSLGAFYLENDIVRVEVNPDVKVFYDNQPISSIVMKNDMQGQPTILEHGSLSWYIIKRQEQLGVRLKDSEHPRLNEFKGIETYPIDKDWRIKATFKPYDPPKTIEVPTILGTISKEPSPGALVFTLNEKTYRLDPIAEPNDKRWFIIFADETNGSETYGAGRYLYVDRPGDDSRTIIDFNKAYNPPCVFSPYATCPFPPDQNYLPVRVEAGEKMYGDSAH